MSRQKVLLIAGAALCLLLFGGGGMALLYANRSIDYPGAYLTDRYRRLSLQGQPSLRASATFTTTDTPRQIRAYYAQRFGLVDGKLPMPQCVLLTRTAAGVFYDHTRNVTFCEASQGRTLLVEEVVTLR